MIIFSRIDSISTEVIQLVRGCESFMKRNGIPNFSSTENSYLFRKSLANLSDAYLRLADVSGDTYWKDRSTDLAPLLSLPKSDDTTEEISRYTSNNFKAPALLENNVNILMQQKAYNVELSESLVNEIQANFAAAQVIFESTNKVPNQFGDDGMPTGVGAFEGTSHGKLLSLYSNYLQTFEGYHDTQLVNATYEEVRQNYFIKTDNGEYIFNGSFKDASQSEFMNISWIGDLYQGLADFLGLIKFLGSDEPTLDLPIPVIGGEVEEYQDRGVNLQAAESITSRPSLVTITNGEVDENDYEKIDIAGRLLYKSHIAQIPFRFNGEYLTPRSSACRQKPFRMISDVTWVFEVELDEWYGAVFGERGNGATFNIALETHGGQKYLDNSRYIEILDPVQQTDPITSEVYYTGRKARYTIDFAEIITGNIDTQEHIDAAAIDAITLNIPSPHYDGAGKDIPNKSENRFKIKVTKSRAYTKSNGETFVTSYVKPIIQKRPNIGMATGFDDIISYSPSYVVGITDKLGYDMDINHYMGMSNYPNLVWSDIDDKFIIDSSGAVDEAVMAWHIDFAKCVDKIDPNGKLIYSVSFELFSDFVGDSQHYWLQRSQPFNVLEVTNGGHQITVEGYYPWSTTEEPLFGGISYKGVFNPDSPYTNYIEYTSDAGALVKVGIGAVTADEGANKTFIWLAEVVPSTLTRIKGKLAVTGYNPPSYFISPCVKDVEDYFVNVFTYIQKGLKAAGVTRPISYQIGEPWWWDGIFQNGLPMTYDDATVAASLVAGVNLDSLKELSEHPTVPTYTPEQEAALKFLSDKLGEFTQAPVLRIGKTIMPNCKWATLIFTPQIFSESNVHLRKMNFPYAHWSYESKTFDESHVEGYDWLISGDMTKVIHYNLHVAFMLGYIKEDYTHLVGFVPATQISLEMWRKILKGFGNGSTIADDQMIWSFTQVVRDGIILQGE